MKEGAIYGDLTVIRLMRGSKGVHPRAVCSCSCGREYTVRQTDLRRGVRRKCVSCVRSDSWVNRPRMNPFELRMREIEQVYTNNAKRRSHRWSLTRAEVRRMFVGACAYCGIQPSMGIDRIDSNIGYIRSNVTSCCSKCNYAKRDMTLSEFDDWINRVARHKGYCK